MAEFIIDANCLLACHRHIGHAYGCQNRKDAVAPFKHQPLPGYHLKPIERGVFGEPSKIVEEATEFADAIAQGSNVMAFVELSDLIGSIEGWLAKHHPTITIQDLITFAGITRRAFENNHRTPR